MDVHIVTESVQLDALELPELFRVSCLQLDRHMGVTFDWSDHRPHTVFSGHADYVDIFLSSARYNGERVGFLIGGETGNEFAQMDVDIAVNAEIVDFELVGATGGHNLPQRVRSHFVRVVCDEDGETGPAVAAELRPRGNVVDFVSTGLNFVERVELGGFNGRVEVDIVRNRHLQGGRSPDESQGGKTKGENFEEHCCCRLLESCYLSSWDVKSRIGFYSHFGMQDDHQRAMETDVP
ncbi:hypothetical protein B0H17DRAFT_1038658 [Mycena rosella]|uniref:Uncharacterized protein n=1 Tax=Mycena rosella TaxID=1033263 RepID=A0AAD7M7N8_MYCRO|nr:hypothetical protein B0H17DRAFT_1038658 [Mycena rosella]